MKILNKLLIPFLLIIIITVIYTTYFAGKNELGLFSNFDTNNSANKEIRVQIVKEQGINFNEQNRTVSFYAADKNGVQYLVEAPSMVDLQSAEIVLLKGHLHEDHFHATEIEID